MSWKTWIGNSGDWSNASNWWGGTPVPGDYIYATSGQITATNVNTQNDFIWLNTTSGSHLTLTLNGSNLGPGSFTLLQGRNSGIETHNAALQGTIYDNLGRSAISVDAGTYAENDGYIGVVGNAPASMTVVADGSFANFGTMASGPDGTMAMFFRSPYLFNNGYIGATAPGAVTNITYLGATSPRGGTLLNQGTIDASGGSVTITTNLYQTPTGKVTVEQGGSLILNGKSDGGTIVIQSGMLGFAATQFAPAPYAAGFFNSSLELTGPTATIDFAGTDISEVFRPATNDLLVTAPFKGGVVQAADIHLVGSYTADEFSASGGKINYVAHPAT